MVGGRLGLLLAILALIGGCFGTVGTVNEVKAPTLALLQKAAHGYVLDVPVQVILIGFADTVAPALQKALDPEEIRHATYDYPINFPPSTSGLNAGTNLPVPITPKAIYKVRSVSPAFEASFFAQYASAQVEGAPGVFDANRLEAWLADNLGNETVLDDHTPSLVLIHGESGIKQQPRYRYTYQFGYLQPVRVFGEKESLLALDVSAPADSFVSVRRSYSQPLSAEGSDTVSALADAVSFAANHRLLQGPIYRPATTTCHAITLIYGIRLTAIPEHVPIARKAKALLDPGLLLRAYENVTGPGTVRLDVKMLSLPVDDPELDAISRHSNDAIRWWINEHWTKYWVPHEGCEPYVSFLIYGDASDSYFGIAMYDVKRTHRISYSEVTDKTQIMKEYDGPGSTLLPLNRNPSTPIYNGVNMLFAHETGHLLAQRHPHDITLHPGLAGRGVTWDFSSIWSTMSYQTGERHVDFGDIDHNNFMRNRAAFLLKAAEDAGHGAHPEVQEAIRLIRQYEWEPASEILLRFTK